MTDNEKAATFIGYTARPCEYWPFKDVHTGLCPECGARDVNGIHNTVAPDMTDPRNYMKALSSAAEHFRVYLEFPRPTWVVVSIWNDKPVPPNLLVAHEQGTRHGEIIVKALAALYDAGHKEK